MASEAEAFMMRALILIVTIFCLAPTLSGANEQLVGMATVIDGDTLEIQGERIRLHGIDAPESSQFCEAKGKSWHCGRQASLALADRIGRSSVRCEVEGRGRYGRAIAVCRIGEVDLNEWMVRRGWALAYRRYSSDYLSAEREAMKAGLGIWQGRFVPPWEWRQGIRLSVVSPTGPVASG